MAAAVLSVPAQSGGGLWLKDRRWDLTFISLSILLVASPYLIYLGMLQLPRLVTPLAAAAGTTPDDLSRNAVNLLVALLVGGPHMYSTFTRTALDTDFAKKNRGFLLSSLFIPAIVVLMAVVNLSLLLTVFFFWASIAISVRPIKPCRISSPCRSRHALMSSGMGIGFPSIIAATSATSVFPSQR